MTGAVLAREVEGDDDSEGGSGGGSAARRRRDWCRCRAWTVSVAWSWHTEQRVWLCCPAILRTGSGPASVVVVVARSASVVVVKIAVNCCGI